MLRSQCAFRVQVNHCLRNAVPRQLELHVLPCALKRLIIGILLLFRTINYVHHFIANRNFFLLCARSCLVYKFIQIVKLLLQGFNLGVKQKVFMSLQHQFMVCRTQPVSEISHLRPQLLLHTCLKDDALL